MNPFCTKVLKHAITWFIVPLVYGVRVANSILFNLTLHAIVVGTSRFEEGIVRLENWRKFKVPNTGIV